jgi:hypothetical protein
MARALEHSPLNLINHSTLFLNTQIAECAVVQVRLYNQSIAVLDNTSSERTSLGVSSILFNLSHRLWQAQIHTMLLNFHQLFYFGTIATAAIIDRRQVPQQGAVVGVGPDGKKQAFGLSFDLEKLAPPLEPLSKANLKARFRSNSIRKVTKYGPFTLPAAKVTSILILNHPSKADEIILTHYRQGRKLSTHTG